MEHLWIFEPWNPGIQKSWNSLDLACFCQFQGAGCFSHSVFVKELDFQCGIQKLYQSWNLPGGTWNYGICLEGGNGPFFLTNLTVFFLICLVNLEWTTRSNENKADKEKGWKSLKKTGFELSILWVVHFMHWEASSRFMDDC